jgi:L-threonylcarbamoyladenylate synthase
MTKTVRLLPDEEGIATAASLLQSGQLVAFPTETVYGLGADATNDKAVAQVFEAKQRPQFNPLIVHVPDLDMAMALAEFSDAALELASQHWPGPLSLVLPVRRGRVSALVSAGLPSIAVRVPAHPIAQDLLRAAGCPIAAPSANPSGRISPTRAEHVLKGLEGRIAAVLDGGPCDVGLESSIVDPGPPLRLLRSGGLDLGETVLAGKTGQIESPGQLSSHYAPNASVRLNATAAHAGEVFLGFGAIPGDVSLSPGGDLVEAAARLFDTLHDLDADGRPIAVAPIPDEGLGRAINDRLRRAAAPR